MGEEQLADLRAEKEQLERLRAVLQEIADNKTNSRTWLESRARRALEEDDDSGEAGISLATEGRKA